MEESRAFLGIQFIITHWFTLGTYFLAPLTPFGLEFDLNFAARKDGCQCASNTCPNFHSFFQSVSATNSSRISCNL
jgi:hypothetical protein